MLESTRSQSENEIRRGQAEAQQEDGDKSQKESGATKLNNLFVSFALLVEAFVEHDIEGSKFRKSDGTPNVTAIADYLSQSSKLPKQVDPLDGQKPDAIRKRISEAIEVKRRKPTKV